MILTMSRRISLPLVGLVKASNQLPLPIPLRLPTTMANCSSQATPVSNLPPKGSRDLIVVYYQSSSRTMMTKKKPRFRLGLSMTTVTGYQTISTTES